MRLGFFMAAAVQLFPAAALAQQTVKVAAGPQYSLGPVGELLVGANWRDVWMREVQVPVLDLGAFAGGLTPFRQGGNQSITLRFHAGDGRTFIFRSTDKFIQKALPTDLQHTQIGYVIQDQTSSMHPTGQLVVTRLQRDLGVLHAEPQLVFMPDDPRLGEYRDAFKNVLGQIEVRPDEVKEGMPLMWGADKISDTEKLFEQLEESLEIKLDEKEYLTARLIDILVGDTDRGADQWRWARYETGKAERIRPIPRDRDYAFMRANGLFPSLARMTFPKLALFGTKYGSLRGLTFMTREFDRTQLVELDWAQWEGIIANLRAKLTDGVIDEAVNNLPREHREESGAYLARALRMRRDSLRSIAWDLYNMVAEEADVFGSNADDVAEIDRRADGSVEVRMYTRAAAAAATDGDRATAFRRVFVPAETKEIRVYLQSGADRAVVRGLARQSIKVRVTGGSGDDVLIDSSRVAANGPYTVFYDAHGANTIRPGPSTRVSEKPYTMAQPLMVFGPEPQPKQKLDVYEERRGRFQDMLPVPDNYVEAKTSAGNRNWGAQDGIGPTGDYREGAGLLVGMGASKTRFGFRHNPYNTRVSVRGFYAIDSGGFGLEAMGDVRPENSKFSLGVSLRGTQFDANRFFGYGNDTEDIDPRLTVVLRNELAVRPSVRWEDGRTSIGVAGILRLTDARPIVGSPADVPDLLGAGSMGQFGFSADMRIDRADNPVVPHSGFRLSGAVAAYPFVVDAGDAFGNAQASASIYLPLGTPTFALRVAGARAWGDFPLHDAAFLGGRTTLRGFRWNRFAGDTEVHGSAELRYPLGRVELLTKGDVGVLALLDAGRVWYQSDSPGGWHTAFGGGAWFNTLGAVFSASYARGAENRFYLQFGLPY